MQHIGVDIIEIDRVRKVAEKWGDSFLKRVFTPSELELYRHRYESLAARFAAKEAVLKALNACDKGISWQDIEILPESNGKPKVRLFRKAQETARQMALESLDVSLSHSEVYAVAFAVGIAGGQVR